MFTGSVFCVFLMVVLDVCYALKSYMNKSSVRGSYVFVLEASTIYLIVNCFYNYYVTHVGQGSYTKANIFYTVALEILICLFNILYNYFADVFDLSARKKRHFYTGIAYSIFLLVIPFLNISSKYSSGLQYFFGARTIGVIAAWGVFLVMTVLLGVFNEKTIKVQNLMSIFVAVIVNVLFMFLQFKYPGAEPINLGIVAFNMVLFIVIENPDVTRIEKEEDINKSKTQFISTMSHEIRTPMNVICGMSEILKRSELTEEQSKYIDNIEKSAESLLLIINDILDYNKINEGKMELVKAPYSLRDLLDDIYLMMKIRIGSSPIELIFDVDENVTDSLVGDANKIRQIVINLVNNAIKFTDKGSITLKVELLGDIEDNVHLKFSVSDTGQGIREADMQKLFTAFGQVDKEKNKNKEGTGLGLSISKDLVELMGGSISLESTYGKGTTFFFDIFQKICSDEDIVPTRKQDFRAIECPEVNILVVDDNHMNLEVFKGMAAPLNAQITAVDNGSEAILLSRDNKYDIMFIDRMMPTLSGEDTVREIRLYRPDVPIIALTADLTTEGRASMAAAGATDFMPKPFNSILLNNHLIKYVSPDKIVYLEGDDGANDIFVPDEDEVLRYKDMGIDLCAAVENCGSKELFEARLRDFDVTVNNEANEARGALEGNDINLYTVKVHAIKSCCYMIGNRPLGDRFFELEKMGKASDTEGISRNNDGAFDELEAFINGLKNDADEDPKEMWPKEKMEGYLNELREFIENGDLITADEIVRELVRCDFDKMQGRFEELKTRVVNFDTDECPKMIDELIKNIKK